ncbi:MAG: 50S ribosomal protein L11 methyltransferase, partial [Candidatus Zixiibacteriota bacterium]
LSRFETELGRFWAGVFPAAPAPAIETHPIAATDWLKQYRESVSPVVVDRTILVRPTWARPSDIEMAEIETEIIINPNLAFGTGSHESTQLCLKALKNSIAPGMRIADVGCGSGILSIYAAKAGGAFVTAIDIDSLAVENCLENIELNATPGAIEALNGSVELLRSDQSYDIVVTNMILSSMLPILEDMIEATVREGKLILSGLLVGDRDEIERALRSLGVSRWEVMRDGQWVCYMTNNPGGR